MSVNNHLYILEKGEDGLQNLDIQFEYGELRELVYRLGDKIYTEEKKSDAVAVVGGIAGVFSGRRGSVQLSGYRYFRIVIVHHHIVACVETSEDDYETIESLTR